MKFTKVIRSEKQEQHPIDIELLNGLEKDIIRLAKFARDMKDAGVKLSTKNKDKIEKAAYIIFHKLEEINHNII